MCDLSTILWGYLCECSGTLPGTTEITGAVDLLSGAGGAGCGEWDARTTTIDQASKDPRTHGNNPTHLLLPLPHRVIRFGLPDCNVNRIYQGVLWLSV